VQGAVIAVDRFRVPLATNAEGRFTVPIDASLARRHVVTVIGAGSARVSGRPLTAAERARVRAANGGIDVAFALSDLEAKVKGNIIDTMKKATALSVTVKNQVNAEVNFNIPLANFGKAYDGPPIDPKVLEEQQKKLQEELQKRADEERKKLESSQASTGGAAAPAGVAPAPAAK
jgi:hypothetical protein